MPLTDLKKTSKIVSVSPLTSVTVNGQTGQVYKCVCENLEYKVLPSPDSGASFQGLSKIIDSSGNVGCLIMVGANPTPSSTGGYSAREVWLAPVSISFLNAEIGNDQAAISNLITVPVSGLSIAFDTITGPTPQNANSITPSGFSGGCVSASLRGHRQDSAEDLAKLAERVNSIASVDLSNLLSDDYSVYSGLDLSWTSGLSVNISAGQASYKGVLFNAAAGSVSGLPAKSLNVIAVNNAGTFFAQQENSTGGTLDCDYNPSGTAPLPSANTPAWTLNGSLSTNSVANSVYSIATTATSGYWNRAGSAGTPSAGSFIDAILRYISGTGFGIRIDFGGSSVKDAVAVENGFISLDSTQERFLFDTTKPFHLRFALKTGESKVYINGKLALSSFSPSTGSSNEFAFGYLSSSTGQMAIARLKSFSSAFYAPSFPALAGCIVGSAIATSSAYSAPVGLIGSTKDYELGNRRLDRLARIGDLDLKFATVWPIGAMMFYPGLTPPVGWLIRNGAEISRNLYAKLFAVIGITYGVGNGSTTFNLPDDRGLFERGWDNGRGYDPGRTFGSEQADEFRAHNHTASRLDGGLQDVALSTAGNRAYRGNTATDGAGGSETRPRNRAYLPIIKY